MNAPHSLFAFSLLFQLVSSHEPATVSSAGGLAWTAPKTWRVAPSPSTMRVVTYQVPAAPSDREDAEVGVFFFGEGQGGGVQANIDRWLGQFTPEKGSSGKSDPTKTRRVKSGGFDVTTVSTSGTYSTGMPGGPAQPKAGWALYGAIVEGAKGPVFFKMVGPQKTVLRAHAELDELIASLRKL